MRARAAEGTLPATAWVNILSIYALSRFAVGRARFRRRRPPRSRCRRPCARRCAAPAFAWSMCFPDPIDDEWNQLVPPPKLCAGRARQSRGESAEGRRRGHLSRRRGAGFHAMARERQGARARDGGHERLEAAACLRSWCATCRAEAARRRPVADAVAALSADRAAAGIRSMRAVPDRGNFALRRARSRLVLEQHLASASTPARISMRRCTGSPAAICRTTAPTRFRPRGSSRRPAWWIARAKSARDADFLLTVDHLRGMGSAARPHPAALMAADAHRLVEAQRSGRVSEFRRRRPAHTGARRRRRWNFWCMSAASSASARRPSAPTPGKPRISGRRIRVTAICTAAGRLGLQCLANLDLLPPTGAIVIAAPLKILHGSGSPVRVLALAPAD